MDMLVKPVVTAGGASAPAGAAVVEPPASPCAANVAAAAARLHSWVSTSLTWSMAARTDSYSKKSAILTLDRMASLKRGSHWTV
eukprot:7830157-Heterocapsa_arctica.AAC.1